MQETDTGRHVYRMKSGLRAFYLLIGLVMCGMGIFFAWKLSQLPNAGAAGLVGIGPAAVGIYLLAMALRSRLTIEGTRIEMRGVFGEKSADRSEVEGFRTINTRNGTYWRLELKQGRGHINIMQWFLSDELKAWFEPVIDLDEQDSTEVLTEIEQNPELGATPEDRLAALKGATRWNIGLSAIAVVAAVVAFAGTAQWQLPAAGVLALTPLAVLYQLNREPLLFALGKARRDPRTDLSLALFVAVIGLFLVIVQTQFVSKIPMLPSMAVATLAFIGCFYMLGRKGPLTRGFHGVVLMCAFFFGMGLIAACDTLLDHAKPAPYAAQVVAKHTSSGRSTTYYLDFAAWGPFDGANKVSVPSSVYQAAEPGDTVCFDVYPGVLHAAWFERAACEGPQDLPTTP